MESLDTNVLIHDNTKLNNKKFKINKLWLLTLINTLLIIIILIFFIEMISAVNSINEKINNEFDNNLSEYINKFKNVLDYFCNNMVKC